MINTNITGETMIFKNDKGFYSTSMSKKMVDGTYQSTYIPVQFKKGVEVENKTTINITKGFLSFDKYTPKGATKETTSWKIIVTEFIVAGASGLTAKGSEFEISSDDLLPF